MAEYIEREAAINVALMDDIDKDFPRMDIAARLHDMPAADVRPVVRGEWIGYLDCLKYTNAYSDDHIVCSACEECFSILNNDCERFNFCPNCGAKMNVAEADDDIPMEYFENGGR